MFREVSNGEVEEVLKLAVLEAGQFLQENAFSNAGLEWKGYDDPVTALDKQAETLIRSIVSKNLNANFIGEEYGFTDNGSPFTVIMDPIDGTKSFIRKDFYCSVSVAVEREGVLIAGAVYDFMRGILYFAGNGSNLLIWQGREIEGSFANLSEKKIFLLDGDGVIANGFARQFKGSVSMKRIGGSTALQMAQLSAGAFDAMIQKNENAKGGVWDVAAGFLLLKNAGFEVLDASRNAFNYKEPWKGIIAFKPALDEKLRKAIFNKRFVRFS